MEIDHARLLAELHAVNFGELKQFMTTLVDSRILNSTRIRSFLRECVAYRNHIDRSPLELILERIGMDGDWCVTFAGVQKRFRRNTVGFYAAYWCLSGNPTVAANFSDSRSPNVVLRNAIRGPEVKFLRRECSPLAAAFASCFHVRRGELEYEWEPGTPRIRAIGS